MPGKLSLYPRNLDELIIDLANDSRRPKLRKSAAHEFQVYWLATNRMRGHRRSIHGKD